MVWFKRNAEGITTSSAEKKEIPEGAWYKCPNCKTVVSNQDHADNLWVCAMCDHHERIEATNTLAFSSTKAIPRSGAQAASHGPAFLRGHQGLHRQAERSAGETGLADAIRVGSGELQGQGVVIACMDFFIGGGMGSVVEKKSPVASTMPSRRRALHLHQQVGVRA